MPLLSHVAIRPNSLILHAIDASEMGRLVTGDTAETPNACPANTHGLRCKPPERGNSFTRITAA